MASSVETTAVILLGATGDLARKKTWPALFKLHAASLLPAGLIVGFAREKVDEAALVQKLERTLLRLKCDTTASGSTAHAAAVSGFLTKCRFVPSMESLTDSPAVYEAIAAIVDAYEAEHASAMHNRLFYFALPPAIYPQVCEHVRAHLTSRGGWMRVVLEKPFGRDLASSEMLASNVAPLFSEEEVYRIDHYLGKELVQNLVVMRFANRFLSPLWNRDNIANVQIIFKEPFGTEGRGGYFDQYGIIRDVIQNHLLQVMALIAMEKPATLDPDDVRDEKLKVLRCIPPLSTDNMVLGQYAPGEDGQPGYLDDPTVPNGSKCPTFAMCVLHVQNDRWDGVPFIIKAGKALNEGKVEIRVQLRDVPGDLFAQRSSRKGVQSRNELVVRLQPNPALYMKITVKEPGMDLAITQSELELRYEQKYAVKTIPDAYEKLILDCLNGDQQHFVRSDELKAAWTIFTPVLHYIDAGGIVPELYPYGSRGPEGADRLREKAGHVTNLSVRDVTWNNHKGNIGGLSPAAAAAAAAAPRSL
mmetsp:Transcript_2092/g.7663  ORF Transcript_2092/g.7663 Transcript_2092/m.7663 type:complete len:530 (-) Transcript_2092:222-1811(-)